MAQTATNPIRLIVGLGNPGDEYKTTRHNMGFMFLDALASKYGARFSAEARFNGDTARITTDAGDLWLLKPTTYMNSSGSAGGSPWRPTSRLSPKRSSSCTMNSTSRRAA